MWCPGIVLRTGEREDTSLEGLVWLWPASDVWEHGKVPVIAERLESALQGNIWGLAVRPGVCE